MTYQQQTADAAITMPADATTDAAASCGSLFYSVSAETASADATTAVTMTVDAIMDAALAETAVNA